ncbi:MAG: hypothetical protein M5U28_14795 [Sandaracinaceae bacterium]|nr:hypothetical protein [Sandaracinaceae bacterium]
MALLAGAAAVSGCGPSYPYCDRDANCRQGEHCVIHRCQQCAHADHCAAGQRCIQGRCE